MIIEKYRKITAVNGVGAGQTFTVNLPLGVRIKDLFLRYKTNAAQATIEADITGLQLNINGQPRRVMTPAQINVKEAHNGLPFSLGVIPIRFRDPTASDDSLEDLTTLNTFRLAQVTITGQIAAGAVAPVIECFANTDSFDDKNDHLVVWDSVPFVNSGAGVKNKTDLIAQGLYTRIDFFGAVLPTHLKVQINEDDKFDVDPVDLQRLAADYKYVTQANHLALLCTHTRRTLEGLDLAGNPRFNIEYTTGAAGDIPAIAERIVKLV